MFFFRSACLTTLTLKKKKKKKVVISNDLTWLAAQIHLKNSTVPCSTILGCVLNTDSEEEIIISCSKLVSLMLRSLRCGKITARGDMATGIWTIKARLVKDMTCSFLSCCSIFLISTNDE